MPCKSVRQAATILGAMAVFSLGSLIAPASAKTAPPTAKITPAQAAKVAVAKIKKGSTTVSNTYEFEDGRWQYAVVVKDKTGQMYEVEVNATTGKVLATEKTSAAEEAKEAAADKKAAESKKNGKSAPAEKDEKDEPAAKK